MSIGERIAELRTKQNMSQVQLSKLLDVSRQAVSKWENDQAAPDTIKLIQLADLLDVDVEYLATGRINQPKVVMTTQTVEKIVEKPVVRYIDKPVVEIRKVYRKKYVRNFWETALVGIGMFLIGLIVGLLF